MIPRPFLLPVMLALLGGLSARADYYLAVPRLLDGPAQDTAANFNAIVVRLPKQAPFRFVNPGAAPCEPQASTAPEYLSCHYPDLPPQVLVSLHQLTDPGYARGDFLLQPKLASAKTSAWELGNVLQVSRTRAGVPIAEREKRLVQQLHAAIRADDEEGRLRAEESIRNFALSQGVTFRKVWYLPEYNILVIDADPKSFKLWMELWVFAGPQRDKKP